jgi:hypothetical protein
MNRQMALMVLCDLMRLKLLERLVDRATTLEEIDQDRRAYFAICLEPDV